MSDLFSYYQDHELTNCSSQHDCPNPVALLLSAQAENLPDACAKTYIHQCKLLFSNSHPNDGGLLLAHKEGRKETRILSRTFISAGCIIDYH